MRQTFIWKRLQAPVSKPHAVTERHFTRASLLHRAFQDGDVVILRDKKDASHDGTLVKLRQANSTSNHRGIIKHADIIGKEPRQIVNSSKGTSYRIHEPTLAEYVRLTPRLVTPIYPSDANLIVSLLDIHVDTAPTSTSAPLEILEAGTGHGALTLHLSRAIHAVNPPRIGNSTQPQSEDGLEDAVYLGESIADLEHSNAESQKRSRCAIVHTLDISEKHSKHARKIVEGFRHGMYASNVDFHVGDISAWIASQKASRSTEDPFLSYVFLDLPNADQHLANVAPVLHVNGLMAVFNPSITQIAECVETIRENKLPYLLDQVIELGAGNIRQWDVRAVRPRSSLRTEPTRPPATKSAADSSDAAIASEDSAPEFVGGQEARDGELSAALASDHEKWAMVCRPKVGERVIGGGFLGLWRRMVPAKTAQSEEA
ncbi:S-adenosyl-L-methionine-dependent methyltransferase [Lophiostoma macrostomum CBS 122681]|uniref:tRNA (adenine(58)-N(1))-methyltransferase catalytic subunit TRM61 n=1 Tax=Lophiostoma macrostomum CBS 122681 TaxID=1314788 RepID=A0A6A6SU99_9PLEO|nr:S-adenosyl-L-methionine-dependent methyltransferase [Lophiostoma macrostomum CBS 122681]